MEKEYMKKRSGDIYREETHKKWKSRYKYKNMIYTKKKHI